MGAFADGMRMGQNAYQQAINNQRQSRADERSELEFADKQTERQYQKTERANVDTALDNYQNLQKNGQYAGGNTTGLSDASAKMVFNQGGQKGLDETTSYANLENRRMGLDSVFKTSLPAQPGGASVPTVQSQPASQRDLLGARRDLAFAKKDTAGLDSIARETSELDWNDGVRKHTKNYTGSEDQVGATSMSMNEGSGRITMGDRDKDGFLQVSIVKGNKRAEFLKLSHQDQAQLYAASMMMESSPDRAMKIISGINKELATAIAAENGMTTKLADSENDRASKRGTLGVARTNASTNSQYKDGMLKLAGEGKSGRGQNSPAEVQTMQWLITNNVAKDATGAWEMVRSAREKTRNSFIMDFTSKNAMPGQDGGKMARDAGAIYDQVQKTTGAGRETQGSNTERVPTMPTDSTTLDFLGLQP